MVRLYKFHSQLILRDYSFFSIGKGESYINYQQTERLFNSYKPALKLLKTLLDKSNNKNEPLALLFSGPFIDLLQKSKPELIQVIKARLKNKEIILFASTYHLSMASLYSNGIFIEDIRGHQSQLKKVFNYEAKIVYNPASIYFDGLANVYENLGFEYALAPSSAWHLNGRSPEQTFFSKDSKIKLFLPTSQSKKRWERLR